MYIEYYIIENLIINYIIIKCTLSLGKIKTNKNRIFTCTIIGTVYSLLYLDSSLNMLFTPIFKLVFILVLVRVLMKNYEKINYIKGIIVFLIINVFISGMTLFFMYFIGMERIKVSFIIMSAYVSCEIIKQIFIEIKNINHLKENEADIELNLFSYKYKCKALMDSGNLLKDPINNSSVVIINNRAVKEFINLDYDESMNLEQIIDSLDYKMKARVRMIPYKDIKNKGSDMILGIKIDHISFKNQYIDNIVIGISDFSEGDYTAIVNPIIFS